MDSDLLTDRALSNSDQALVMVGTSANIWVVYNMGFEGTLNEWVREMSRASCASKERQRIPDIIIISSELSRAKASSEKWLCTKAASQCEHNARKYTYGRYQACQVRQLELDN